jgi:hypothetical protein
MDYSDAWTSFRPSSGCPQLPELNDDLPRIKLKTEQQLPFKHFGGFILW